MRRGVRWWSAGRVAAPVVALALVLGGTLAGPATASRGHEQARDAGRDRDGQAHRLRPADAAQLAEALGVRAATPAAARRKAARVASRTVRQAPSTGPDFELPFACGTRWTGTTRASHSPNRLTVDFNAPNDHRQPVLASAPGTVVLVRSLTYSYGRYVVIDHGGGFTTLYAHLDSLAVSTGQRVDQGDLVGLLGTSGGSTGPHLHFEQRRSGAYFAPYFSRTTWRFGSTAASGNCGDRPVAGDWDGDGTDEVGVFRSRATGGEFHLRGAAGTDVVPWGGNGDTPVVADFDGDGVSQVGTKRLGQAVWQLRSASGAAATVTGVVRPTDLPLAADWDGDGLAELGAYAWASRLFTLRWPDHSLRTRTWGASGRVPVVGDWDGDGAADVGSFDPVAGTWQLSVAGATVSLAHGAPGDLPVVGDWDGDGDDEVGVWRPSTGVFWLRSDLSPTGSSATVVHGVPRG